MSPRAQGVPSVVARFAVRCSSAWDARGRTGRPLKGRGCPGPSEGRLQGAPGTAEEVYSRRL